MTDQYTKLADALAKVASNYTSSMYREDSEHIREAARILRAAGAADVEGLMHAADRYALSQSDPAHWRAALESALRVAMAQRAGFVMVPVEPTEAMLEAAHNGDREYTLRNFGDIMTVMQGPYDHWRAMIAASQAGAAQEPKP